MIKSARTHLLDAFECLVVGLLALAIVSAFPPPVQAQGISQKVAICDPNFVNLCLGPGPRAGTNASGTVTVGNTFQTVIAASATRRACIVQNPTTATEVLFVNFGVLGSATTATSVTLSAGMYVTCGNPGGSTDSAAVNVTAATNGHAFFARYQ